VQYDIAVIGNDEAAIETLCLAAQSGKRVAAILPESCQSAWFTGQALRRLVSDLLVDRSESRQALLSRIASPRLLQRLLTNALVQETTELAELLEHLGIDVRIGQPRFVNRSTLRIADGRTCETMELTADAIVIGTGVRLTSLYSPLGLVAEQRPESLFAAAEMPESLCVLGGGSVGAGMAALFALFGVPVSHVVGEADDAAMLELAESAGVNLVASSVDVASRNVVDFRRAIGFTETLNLSAIAVEADENGRLWCSTGLETWCDGVYGVGDVVGFSPDAALHPSIQAERVMRRLGGVVPQPHFFDAFAAADEWDVVTRVPAFVGV